MRKFKFTDYDSATIDKALDRICQDLARSAEAAKQTHNRLRNQESIRLLSDLLADDGQPDEGALDFISPPSGTKFN